MKVKAFFSAMVAVLKGITPDEKQALIAPLEAQVSVMQDDDDTPPANKNKKDDDTSAKISPEAQAIIDAMQNENKELKDAMQKIIARDADREKTQSEREADALKTKVAAKIEDLKKAGTIPADNKDLEAHWNKMLTADFDGASKIIDAMPKGAGSSTGTKKDGDGSGSKEGEGKTAATTAIGRAANSKMLQYVSTNVESQ